MIGKELLSGFWECPESLRCWTSLLTLGPFHLGFTLVSPLQLLHGIVVAGNLSVTSWVVMPARLALCDLGAPGWGEPWFPHSAVLLYSHLGMAMSVMFVFSVLPLLYLPYQYKWWYKDITLTHYRGYITGLPVTFPLLGLFCAVCFGLFCLCFALWFCFVFRFLLCDGIVTALDYVAVHHQFTFAATQ